MFKIKKKNSEVMSSLRLRGGGGYDQEEEERCREAVIVLHKAHSGMTSEKCASLLLEIYGVDKSDTWVRRWWNRSSGKTKKAAESFKLVRSFQTRLQQLPAADYGVLAK